MPYNKYVENQMNTVANSTVLAIPSHAPGGIDATISQHFGHCEVFTLVTIAEHQIERTAVIPGIPHEHGGCMAPIRLLADQGANAMIVAGMGRRPLQGFATVGISIFHSAEATTVGEAINDFRAGRLQQFDISLACGEHHHS